MLDFGRGLPRRCLVTALLLGVVTGCSRNGLPEYQPAPQVVGSGSAETVFGTPGNPRFYEVFGRRYHVLPTSSGYRERGIASWYGPKFHGKRTSGGETYDMHGMTAAHKTLPIPSWVEVTNLENDRRIVVRINDRGPFVHDRIIDLSYRAAQELDIVGNGTARVHVRALESPSDSGESGRRGRRAAAAEATEAAAEAAVAVAVAAEAAVAAAPQPSVGADRSAGRPSGSDSRPAREPGQRFSLISSAHAADRSVDDGLYVQVGAFSDRDNALGLVARLKRSGFDNTFVLAGGNDELYRVRIGPFADAGGFDDVQSALSDLGLHGSRLVTAEF